MKRVMEFEFDRDCLSIRIECEHGSLYASNFQELDNLVSVRYMVNELRKDEDVSKVFDIVFKEPEASNGLD